MHLEPALLAQVEMLLRETGRYQLSEFRHQPPGGGDEKTAREFVSEVDINSEQMLIKGLKKLIPEAGFYGEETGQTGNQDLVWIIDPLDGTTNYLSGVDQFSISVALVENSQPILGVVYKPWSQDMFSAIKGYDFQHNGNVTQAVSPKIGLEQALIGTGFPYRSPDLAEAFFSAAELVLYASRGIRRMGSAALDLSYLGAGYFQGFWESDLQPYDVAAALLFLQLQGCQVTNEHGQPYNMFTDRLLIAGYPGVYDHLFELIARHYQQG